jgi:molybdate transport system substrate-binding protein
MTIFKRMMLMTLLLSATAVQAGEVKVAVAANFYKPMMQLAQEFEQATGNSVTLSAGSTGSLYAQIKNGAPFEVFLAADQRRPKALVSDKLGVNGSRFTYAQGQLAFWSMKSDYKTQQDFIDAVSQVEHIAIANPKNAPYGAATIDAMKALGVYQQAQPKIVEGNNIGQTYQYVSSETVSCGFVALSQIYQNGKITEGSAWLVPSSLHRVLKQDAVLLNQGQSSDVAKALLAFLQSEPAKQTIRSFGYKI